MTEQKALNMVVSAEKYLYAVRKFTPEVSAACDILCELSCLMIRAYGLEVSAVAACDYSNNKWDKISSSIER